MGVYIELPKEWAKWSFDVRDIHDNILEAKVTDLDLIRCGVCKWQKINNKNGTKSCGHKFGMIHADGFCSYGERRKQCID